MATQRVTRNSQQQNRISQGSNSRQTSLLDWMVKDKSGNFKSVLKESSSVEDSTRTDDRTEGALQVAVGYFQKGPKKASLSKDKVLEKHLTTVENVALSNGLAPEAIDILLNVALSGKFGNAVNSRILKCMIPESHISEDSVLKAVSWLCVDKCSGNTKVLFYRWLVAMFDFIDHKKQISSLYGFFFASLQDDTLTLAHHGGSLPPDLQFSGEDSSPTPSTSPSDSAGTSSASTDEDMETEAVNEILEDIPEHEEDYLDSTLEDEEVIIAEYLSYVESISSAAKNN